MRNRGLGPLSAHDTPASQARMYDYYLGGKDYYEVDEVAAEQVIAAHPHQRQLARNNRGFLARAVTHLAATGIDQYVDVGTGIPTRPNVHELAFSQHPSARVAYVDNDPTVIAHDRALLAQKDLENIAVVDADMRDPDALLADSDLRAMIDFDRPVAVLLVAVLHFMPDPTATEIVTRLRRDLVPGSALVLSTACSDGLPAEQLAAIQSAYTTTATGAVLRARADIEAFFDGLTLVSPGVVDVAQWRNDDPPTPISILGGVGLVP